MSLYSGFILLSVNNNFSTTYSVPVDVVYRGAVPLVSQTTQSDTTMRQLGRRKPASAGLCVA